MTVRLSEPSNPLSSIRRLWHALSKGYLLDGEVWARRHRRIVFAPVDSRRGRTLVCAADEPSRMASLLRQHGSGWAPRTGGISVFITSSRMPVLPALWAGRHLVLG